MVGHCELGIQSLEELRTLEEFIVPLTTLQKLKDFRGIDGLGGI